MHNRLLGWLRNKWVRIGLVVVVAVGLLYGAFVFGESRGVSKPTVVTPTSTPKPTPTPTPTLTPTPAPTSTSVVSQPPVVVNVTVNQNQTVNGSENKSLPLLPPLIPPLTAGYKFFGIEIPGRYEFFITPCDVILIIDGQEVKNGQIVYLARGWHTCWSISTVYSFRQNWLGY